ncbi:MAG TPA: riboflavin biosynthesis protein RibF [Sphingobacteriaceae bacterium]|nr:riboflavin biosynthesis protein RibF [Sphingobacteriaceae bacterium]
MKIYPHIKDFVKIDHAIVTIGTFDGVHLGHQKIINRLREIADETGGETVILTFFPHPRMILHPEDVNIKMITTMDERAELLEKHKIDHLIITPFTRDFSNLSPEEYISQVLVEQVGIKKIIIGYDHRFGKNREGGLKELQRLGPVYNFEVEEISEQDVNDVAVSSTKIRAALSEGDIETANEFLGYPFGITGKVVRGDEIGRQLGFPTANLFVEQTYKIIPADGIYAVHVLVDEKEYLGMCYIGNRPTINGMTRNIEVNIFDFDQDIYDKNIRLNFLHFIRGDTKFNNLEELKIQIGKDKEAVLEVLK